MIKGTSLILLQQNNFCFDCRTIDQNEAHNDSACASHDSKIATTVSHKPLSILTATRSHLPELRMLSARALCKMTSLLWARISFSCTRSRGNSRGSFFRGEGRTQLCDEVVSTFIVWISNVRPISSWRKCVTIYFFVVLSFSHYICTQIHTHASAHAHTHLLVQVDTYKLPSHAFTTTENFSYSRRSMKMNNVYCSMLFFFQRRRQETSLPLVQSNKHRRTAWLHTWFYVAATLSCSALDYSFEASG